MLSKSSLLKGFQCPKQLYLYYYHYDLMDQVSDSQQAIFDTGHKVGELARQLFPNGVNCAAETARDYQLCVSKTKKQLDAGAKVIYEAGFIFDDMVAIADIVVVKKDGLHIYEVKSSTCVKDVHRLDAAIQYYVITGSGYKVKDISVVCINNKYVRCGALEIDKLFTTESVTDEIIDMQKGITKEIKSLKKMLDSRTEPHSDLGPHCSDPYGCSFTGHCWNDIPDYSVFNISGLKKDKVWDLYANGIIKIEDVPDDYPLSALQKIQVDAHKQGRDFIDEDAVREFMESVPLPAYFMDFETFNPAVPMFDGSRPYQQIPFQYSVHYIGKNGKITHTPFLANTEDGDPRKSFLETLLAATPGNEDILVYNKAFEETRLKELAEDFPQYKKEINKRIERLKDLMVPFRKKWYYKPEMYGGYSIKNVLPALVPDLSYDELEIGDGSTASKAFESLYYQKDKIISSIIRSQLLDYCKTDTLAMVEVYKVLKEI